MKNLFNSIQLKKPKTNTFDLTHDVKLSFNMGELIPILCLECVPGDSFNISCESLVRFAPLVSPVMHRMDVYMHYFFVPNRIIWDGWEDFITGNTLQGPGGPSSTPVVPYIQVSTNATTGVAAFTPLMDYMGVPTPDVNTPTPPNTNVEIINALPFGAYLKIYDDYYRDQNLIGNFSSGTNLVDGDNTAGVASNPGLGILRIRAWEHDYFTSALPWAQKGAAVEIPLGRPILDSSSTVAGKFVTATGHLDDNWTAGLASSGAAGEVVLASGAPKPGVYDPQGSLIVEPTAINDLRRAFRLQEWLEKNARAGTRYTENILAHFGVRSSDKRLQRPEYITGTRSPVVISEILNTTGPTLTGSDPNNLPQGNMAGHGVSVTSGQYGRYFCEEHGYIIGIMSILPKTAYYQGMPRHFLKGFATGNSRFDWYWPEFANIGEQAVYNREIFAFNGTTTEPFGYVPRYAEYKYMPSRVCGDFRTNLAFWHLARTFSSQPTLSQQFIECVPRTDIFAVEDPSTQKMYAHVLNKIIAKRPMPKFGTPQF